MTAPPDWLRPLLDAARTAPPASIVAPPEETDGLRSAAVLVLFGEGPRGPDVLLLRRSDDLRHHPGQPAFPGGGIDPTDAGPEAAALREAHEETGLEPAGVDVLMTLPELFLPPSGNLVTPVLAWWREPSEVGPVDPIEVAAVARVPIAELVEPANRVMVEHPMRFDSPGFQVAGLLVWGFTAGILDQLLRLAGWEKPWDRSVKVPFPIPQPRT
jgi:8-oxo-dGTP pyrophosphatase MutT (NUDIX family)